jgi:hypothetical protein
MFTYINKIWDRDIICYLFILYSNPSPASLFRQIQFQAKLRLIDTYHAVPLQRQCLAAKSLDCVFPIWFTQYDRVWYSHAMPRPCHATTMPFWKRLLKATAHSGMGAAWYVWISIGFPEMACGRPTRVRLLPATTRSSTKVVIRSIPIR